MYEKPMIQFTFRIRVIATSEGTIGTFCNIQILEIFNIGGELFKIRYDESKFIVHLLIQSNLGLPSHFIRAAEGSLIDSLTLYSKPCCTTVNPKMQLNKHN